MASKPDTPLASQQTLQGGLSNDMLISLSMNFNNDGASQDELVSNLHRNGILKTESVIDAMKKTDRKDFVNPKHGPLYEDKPRNIGCEATITSPHMHAIALEALFSEDETESESTSRREKPFIGLDIGCGSGYLTVCMGHILASDDSKIYGIDHARELIELSRNNTAKSHQSFLDSGRVAYYEGDGFLGLPEKGPFDFIHVGAAVEEIPEELVNQLTPGGALVIPVGPQGGEQKLVKLTKLSSSSASSDVRKEEIMTVVFSRMNDEPPKSEKEKAQGIAEEMRELYKEGKEITEALQHWQATFKTEHGRKPSAGDMAKDTRIKGLLTRFKDLQREIQKTENTFSKARQEEEKEAA